MLKHKNVNAKLSHGFSKRGGKEQDNFGKGDVRKAMTYDRKKTVHYMCPAFHELWLTVYIR